MTQPSSVPPPSPLPPVPRPQRGPILRLILWFTEPSMIKGMAVGIVLALLGAVALKLNAAWYIAMGMLLVIAALIFGAVIGHYVFEAKRKKLQRHGLEMLRQAGSELPGLGDDLAVVVLNRDTSHLPGVWERLRRMRPMVEEVAGLGIAAFFRISALSALFAVLGSAISFAVFLTSYMQVERMTEQNELINAQTRLTEDQLKFEKQRQAVEIALSIADRRQLTARELFVTISGDPERRSGKLSESTRLFVSASVAQLEPYHGVDPLNDNKISDKLKSPEQEQLLRYLAAIRVDISEINLDRAYLDYVALHNVELPQIQLRGVKARSAAFYDSKLAGADLALADLSGSQFTRSDLGGANLSDAKLRGAILYDAILTDANLVRADLTGANLKEAVLGQTQLGSAILHGVDFTQCDLTTTDLTDADITLADLSALAKTPTVPKVRAAASWWLAVYADDYAGKLGVSPDQLAKNREALGRLRVAPTPEAAAAIVAELKAASPKAPG